MEHEQERTTSTPLYPIQAKVSRPSKLEPPPIAPKPPRTRFAYFRNWTPSPEWCKEAINDFKDFQENADYKGDIVDSAMPTTVEQSTSTTEVLLISPFKYNWDENRTNEQRNGGDYESLTTLKQDSDQVHINVQNAVGDFAIPSIPEQNSNEVQTNLHDDVNVSAMLSIPEQSTYIKSSDPSFDIRAKFSQITNLDEVQTILQDDVNGSRMVFILEQTSGEINNTVQYDVSGFTIPSIPEQNLDKDQTKLQYGVNVSAMLSIPEQGAYIKSSDPSFDIRAKFSQIKNLDEVQTNLQDDVNGSRMVFILEQASGEINNTVQYDVSRFTIPSIPEQFSNEVQTNLQGDVNDSAMLSIPAQDSDEVKTNLQDNVNVSAMLSIPEQVIDAGELNKSVSGSTMSSNREQETNENHIKVVANITHDICSADVEQAVVFMHKSPTPSATTSPKISPKISATAILRKKVAQNFIYKFKKEPFKTKFADSRPYGQSIQTTNVRTKSALPISKEKSRTAERRPRQSGGLARSSDIVDLAPMQETGFFDLGFQPLLLAPYLTKSLKKLKPCPPQLTEDFIVLAGNEKIECELAVLQCYSSIFSLCQPNSVYKLDRSITAEAFKELYCWMTSDDMEIMTTDIVMMLNASEKLEVVELKAELSCLFSEMASSIGEDFTFTMYLEARDFGLSEFNFALLHCRKFFLTLVATKDFVMLSKVELFRLLSSNFICVNTEAEVLMAAVRWLLYDWPSRKYLLVQVMKFVRVPLLSRCFIRALIRGSLDNVLNAFGRQPAVVAALHKGTTARVKPRNWIWDPNCQYHERKVPTKNYNPCRIVTYEKFKKYLGFLKDQPPGYFKELKSII